MKNVKHKMPTLLPFSIMRNSDLVRHPTQQFS